MFWLIYLPLVLGILTTILFVLTFNNLNLPSAILIFLGGLIPTVGYIGPLAYLIALYVNEWNIRRDTALGRFINKWYNLGNI